MRLRYDRPDPQMMEVYRAMTPERRVAAGLAATDLIRQRLFADLAERHPDLSEGELWRAVARRLLDGRG